MRGPQWVRVCAEMFKRFVVGLGAGETRVQGKTALASV